MIEPYFTFPSSALWKSVLFGRCVWVWVGVCQSVRPLRGVTFEFLLCRPPFSSSCISLTVNNREEKSERTRAGGFRWFEKKALSVSRVVLDHLHTPHNQHVCATGIYQCRHSYPSSSFFNLLPPLVVNTTTMMIHSFYSVSLVLKEKESNQRSIHQSFEKIDACPKAEL